jgi:flagellar biosynthesis protein FlhB
MNQSKNEKENKLEKKMKKRFSVVKLNIIFFFYFKKKRMRTTKLTQSSLIVCYSTWHSLISSIYVYIVGDFMLESGLDFIFVFNFI